MDMYIQTSDIKYMLFERLCLGIIEKHSHAISTTLQHAISTTLQNVIYTALQNVISTTLQTVIPTTLHQHVISITLRNVISTMLRNAISTALQNVISTRPVLGTIWTYISTHLLLFGVDDIMSHALLFLFGTIQ
jgi:Fe-S cluster biogenesis protein NfuA